jgi:type III pantothenate kinase
MPEEHRLAGGSGRQVVLIDAGNTNTVFGVYVGDQLVEHLRLSTARERTADEYGALLLPLFARLGLDAGATDSVMVSSVVPPMNLTMEILAREYFKSTAVFIEPGIRTGMPIRYDNPAEVGADRIVNSVAAIELYGAPVVVVDFGTATTFDVVNRDGEYVGGIITPGLGISAEALFARASRLYRVDVRKPRRLVGSNTSDAMQSGIYYGYVGQVDGILKRLHEEIPELENVVATGGLAELIAEGTQLIRVVNPMLTLIGLKLIHDRQFGA